MEFATKVVRYEIYALSLGVAGAAATHFPQLPNLLSVIGIAGTSAEVVAKKFHIASFLDKFHHRSFPISLWTLEREIAREEP